MIKETVLSRSLRAMFAGGVAVGIGVLALPAMAQEAAQATSDAPAMQRVEVTGSSIKRTDIEGALPVQTVTHEDIQKLGVTSTEQLLTSLSSISAVGGSNVAEGVGASTYGESTASLRGLGANKTLILVNGRRLAAYATDNTSAVDVNQIPLASIDHVEVLKDGASGVYGSDAIGGVINFITRQNFQGYEATGYASGTRDGGGQSDKASILAGWGDFDTDRYNITLSADVNHDGEITGAQRTYSQQAWNNNGLRDVSATGSGNVGIVGGATLGNPLSPGNCAQNGNQFDANLGTCRFNSAPFADLMPEVSRTNLGGSFRFKLNDNNELYAEGFYSHQLTTTRAQSSPYSPSFQGPDTLFAKNGVNPGIIISPTSPFYPTAWLTANHPSALGQPLTTSYRAFDGGNRQHEDVANGTHLVLGERGSFHGYDYDIAYVHNSSDVTESTESGYESQFALVSLLSNNNAFNPFARNQTPALAAQIRATDYDGEMINSTLTNDSINAHISGDLYKLPAGMASFAIGGSLSDENLKFNPSAAFQTGDISGYGGNALPFSASRNSSALFAELNVPIIKHLEADLAVREDKYPNAKATDPKISLRYQPISQVLLRASYGKGFREPSLVELNTPQTFGVGNSFTDPKTGTFGQFNTIAGGNANLQPEKSEQSDIGIVIEPIKNLSLSIDYWKINVKNLIQPLSPQFVVEQVAAGNPAYTGLVQRDANGEISSITALDANQGSLKTSGIDLDLKWQIAKTDNYGTFSTHLNGTYTSKYDETLVDGTVQHSVAATVDSNGNPLNAVNNGGIIFRWKDQLDLNWKYKSVGLDLINNYQSGYYDNTRADSSTVVPVHVGGFSTWDSQLSYSGVKNLVVRVGLKNMFNRLPPEAITLGSYFQQGYDPTYYDAHGQTAYVNATYKF
jgi:iron complex outermembrane receptor protein